MNKIILILFLFVGFDSYADSTFVSSDNAAIELEDFESFKIEFKLMGGQQQYQLQQNANGEWVLVPIGVVMVSFGVPMFIAGFLVGGFFGTQAQDFNEKLMAGTAGVFVSAIGVGLTYFGAKLVGIGSRGGKSKNKEISEIIKFDGY